PISKPAGSVQAGPTCGRARRPGPGNLRVHRNCETGWSRRGPTITDCSRVRFAPQSRNGTDRANHAAFPPKADLQSTRQPLPPEAKLRVTPAPAQNAQFELYPRTPAIDFPTISPIPR